ncbi:MAG: hypothetical protein L6V84_00100 [Oscillospiraceae bacterium]|nr:MAG: hypothetical protein L6V84_00100 [Oscillospiraceae bacterium]
MYVSNMEKNTVYLCRADVYFKGILNKNVILFPDAGMEFPEGRLNSDGETFLFCDVSREEVAATLYEMGAGKGLNELIKIYLDRANGITYSVKRMNRIRRPPTPRVSSTLMRTDTWWQPSPRVK